MTACAALIGSFFSGYTDLVKDFLLMLIVFMELLLMELYLIFQQCVSGSVFTGTYFLVQRLEAE